MDSPHDVRWLLVVLPITIAVLALAHLLRRFKPAAIPKLVPALIGWGVLFEVGLLLGIRAWDNSRLRGEFRATVAAGISDLELSHGGASTRLTNEARIAELRMELSSIGGVMSHHSHPLDDWTISFLSAGRPYCCALAQDSRRPDEYWVFRITDPRVPQKRENIGRIESARLGAWLRDGQAGR